VHSTAGHQRRLNFLDWSSPPGKNSRDTYYRSPELRLVHSTWLNSTDLWEVDPRRVHWSHASASRLYLVLIGCSETRTASARSVLKTCDMYSNAAVHTGDRELEFSSVHVLWTSLYFLSLSRAVLGLPAFGTSATQLYGTHYRPAFVRVATRIGCTHDLWVDKTPFFHAAAESELGHTSWMRPSVELGCRGTGLEIFLKGIFGLDPLSKFCNKYAIIFL